MFLSISFLDTEKQSEQHDKPEDWNTILVIFYNQ